jgi:selenocysteine lyase/cysteine desulfurase
MSIAAPSSASSASLDPTWVRAQFPALTRMIDGSLAVFMDGPGGTQVPQCVIDAIWQATTPIPTVPISPAGTPTE